jgi:hypothetical protein
VIEEEIREGDPNKPTDVYQIWVKGLNINGGFVSGGSATESWIKEPPKGIPKLTIIPVKELPTNQTPWTPPTVKVTFPVFNPPVDIPPTVPTKEKSGSVIPRSVVFSGVGATYTSPLMTHELKEYFDDLSNSLKDIPLKEIEVEVSIGERTVEDGGNVSRSGFLTLNATTLRPTVNGKGKKIMVPNTNDRMNIHNVTSAIEESIIYVKGLFSKRATIKTKINYNTKDTGVTYKFNFK